jgi:photosystem II stability/assembly factor-like uncharacterized protein
MRKIYIILLFCLITTPPLFSQWVQQPTGTTADLYSIKFINRYTGWACGGGVILKTTNSGNNWNLLSLPVSKQFFKLHPVDSNVIYCVGMFETIIKSTNGGTNWQIIRDGPYMSNTYYCCYFINQNTGWISGGGEQKILKTTNGGITFDSIVTFTPGFIKDIYFRDSLTGLYCDDNGAVRKTTNGGYNWFSINIPVGTFSYDFRNFSFINNLSGWTITFSGKVFKTTDFGSNWDSTCTIQNGGNELHCIFFSSNNIGYAGGAGYYLYRTTNSGYNWVQHYIPYPLNGASSFYFFNDSVGWKVTNSGKICYTTNGGQNTQFVNNNGEYTNSFSLFQNYPNPFNLTTSIEFNIQDNGFYKLEVFDLLGREIKTLVNEFKQAGSYLVSFNGSEFASGIYFYRIEAGNFTQVKRMVLIK